MNQKIHQSLIVLKPSIDEMIMLIINNKNNNATKYDKNKR